MCSDPPTRAPGGGGLDRTPTTERGQDVGRGPGDAVDPCWPRAGVPGDGAAQTWPVRASQFRVHSSLAQHRAMGKSGEPDARTSSIGRSRRRNYRLRYHPVHFGGGDGGQDPVQLVTEEGAGDCSSSTRS